MPVLARQPELLRHLRSPEGRSLRELSALFGVSKNTIQRDLDQLSTAAFPITESQVGQRLLYRLADATPPSPPEPLSPAELAPLLTALWPWRRASWFKRLKARLTPSGLDRADLDASAPEPKTPGSTPTMTHLVRGLLEHRLVRIAYRRRDGTRDHRTLAPARLRVAEGLLYLDAHLEPAGALRTYAVHLITDARATKKPFTPRPLPARTAFGAVEGEPVEAVVRFAAPVAPFIRERRWHPSERLETTGDGGLIWRGTVSGEHEFIGWVLSWAPWAELVSPLEWRAKIRQRARALAAQHR